MKRTVLLIETGEGGGGSFVSLVTFLKQMDRNAFRPVVCCFNPTRFLDEIKDMDIPVVIMDDPVFSRRPALRYLLMRIVQRVVNQFIPRVRPLYERVIHAGTIGRLLKTARQTSAELIVLNTQINRDFFGLFLAEKSGLPVAAHLQSRSGTGLTPAVAERVNRQVSRMIANSAACRDYWVERGLDASKIEIIYNAVAPQNVRPADLNALFGMAPGVPVVCCVGRLIDIKGQDILLQAFARLGSRYSNAALLLVGDGKRRKRLEKLADALHIRPRVVFAGWRTDACALIAASDVLVLPSREEALGLTLLEGMSAGTPVIGSRAGGIPEVIADGENGLLFKTGDPDGLAAAIERMLSDSALREKLIAGGRREIAGKFSVNAYVKQVANVYSRALDPGVAREAPLSRGSDRRERQKNRTTRIAYIVSTLKRCGPNSQLRNIIRHLDRTQFDPLVITLSPEPDDSVRPLFEQDGIPVASLNLSRIEGLFAARRKLRRLLKEKGVGLLHTQGIRADSLAAALRNEWPAVCSVRNFPQLDYPMTYGKLRGKWMAYSHARALRRAAAPVGVSGAVSQNLKTCFGVQAQTIRNGVDTAVWTPASAEERASLRRKPGWRPEETVWISTGHLSERKDPLAVIRAFRQAESKNARLVFLGSGPLEAECRRAADGCAQIVFAGRVENVADWLRAADGFISASHAEGFPNAVLEALACGLPCVLSDIPPHRELAEQAGRCIRLFSGAGEASEQIARLEINETLRLQARASAENCFSAAAASEKYQMIYRELS